MGLIVFLFLLNTIVAQENKTFYTIVFVDKSASSDNNSNAKAEFKSSIHSIINARYRKVNSEIRGYTIQQGTLSTSSFIDDAFKFTPKSCKDCGSMKQKMVEQQNQLHVLKIQNGVQKKIIDQFNALNPNSSNQYTDLWGSLELISRFLDGKTGDRLVIYSSDMVESMSGKGRRDFHKNPIKDRTQAINLAIQDFTWIKNNLSLNLSVFKGLKIEVWPPRNTLEGSKHPFTIYYWETLFGKLGAKLEWK